MDSPLILALLLFPLFFLLQKVLQRTKNHPPGPPSLPIIGNFHQLGEMPHVTLWNLSKKYGSVMLIKLGFVPTLVISSSEAARELFKNHDLETCSRPGLTGTGKLSYNYLDVAFAPYGDYWREMRRLCVYELFNAKRVMSYRPVREGEISLLIDSIRKCASSSSTVDISEKMVTLTASITCRAAFGKSFQEKGFGREQFQEVIHEGSAMLGSFSAADIFPYVGWIVDRITGLHARLEKNFQEFDSFYEKIIDEHVQKRKRGDHQHEVQDILDGLLELEKNQMQDKSAGSFHFSRNHIKAVLMNIFLAGLDTGSITLTWAMAELVKNPRVMKKVQEEIRSCIGPDSTRINESDIEKLGYMKMVVKETLRLHPPGVLLLPRETISHFKINGYDVYPGTRIQVNVWAIGRDPKVWKNPEEFCPERFIDSTVDFKGTTFEMLPFGGGRRGCPGITMGMATVELALANMLFCFDWKLPGNVKGEDLNMEEDTALTVFKKEPLVLVPIAYQPPSK